MLVSQKCHYALRAVFELCKRHGLGPIKIAEIAETQSIPPRFLEVILGQLKQGGFVESRRGNEGGYLLSKHPADLSVGDIISFIHGPMVDDNDQAGKEKRSGARDSYDVFDPMWQAVSHAITDVYDNTRFTDLVEMEKRMSKNFVPSYSI